MESARKERLRETQKRQWADCEIIAVKLGDVTKNQVHDHLYREIVERGWLDKAVAGDAETLGFIRNLDNWDRMLSQPKPIVVDDHPRIHPPKEREDLDSAGELQIAMWFIAKMGSPERATKVLKAAIAATKD